MERPGITTFENHPESNFPHMKKVIIIFTLISLIPLGIIGGGLYWMADKKTTFESYERAKGFIVKVKEDKVFEYPYQEKNFFHPIVLYHNNKGESFTVELKKRSGGNTTYEAGKEIDLLYNPRKPDDVLIDSFMSKWFGPTLLCAVGLLMLGIVIIVGFMWKKSWRRLS